VPKHLFVTTFTTC